MEEYDIYQTNTSLAPSEPSVQNEFQIDLEQDKNEVKMDQNPNLNPNPITVTSPVLMKTESLPLKGESNIIKPRSSFVFGQTPIFSNLGQGLQSIQEYEKTKINKISKKVVFGLTHCPGKNHIKKSSKKVQSSKKIILRKWKQKDYFSKYCI